MSAPHPFLREGMILWVGKDPRTNNYCYLEYGGQTGRGMCFPECLPLMKQLGIKVTPHWKPHLADEGYYGAYHVMYRKIDDYTYYSNVIRVSPVIEEIAKQGMTNTAFKGLLKKEEI